MRRRTLAAVAVASVLVLAGCGGAGPADGTTTGPPTTTPSGSAPDYEAFVFDSGLTGHPIIEGGITPDDQFGNTSYYATLLTDASQTERFNRSQLPDEAEQFVEETDFEMASLVVLQSYPRSSVPDYRVESVTRDGGRLDVRINDSSAMGTDDITVETVLIRVEHSGTAPTSAQITPQEDVSFATGEGPVTITPPGDDEQSMYDVTLPLRSDNESRNVEDPRDLTVENTGDETNGYNVTITAMIEPACRDSTPPCMAPAKEVVVFQEVGKLQPGKSVTFENLIARHGEYDLTVEADLPQGESSRQTITKTVGWQIDDDHGNLAVTITDEDIQTTQ